MNTVSLKDDNLYYIGGVVRDKLLGCESRDIDLTYAGNAIDFAKNLSGIEILQINEPFGTVKVKLDGQEIDIASTRSETYPQKGHLPVVCNIGCPLKDDIMRRDFTINALAMSTKTGEIIDYTEGLKDIQNKKLRVLHKAGFIDDPTRILRGLKFSVRFGFELDEKTKKLQKDYLHNVNYDMSYKRLKKELIETFNLNSWLAFKIFTEQEMYKLIAPQKFKLPETNLEPLIKKYKPDNIWIIYTGLLDDISPLPLTKEEQAIAAGYKTLKGKIFKNNFELYQEMNRVPVESVIMYAANDYSTAEKYLEKLRNVKIALTGADLISLGLKPSPKFKQCFDFILKEKLANPNLDKEQELHLARKYLEKSNLPDN